MKNTVSRMNAFQIGLCTFKYDKEAKIYSSRPFNIYLFAHSDNYIEIDDRQPILAFQPSCLRFNVKNNFNFNKLFR